MDREVFRYVAPRWSLPADLALGASIVLTFLYLSQGSWLQWAALAAVFSPWLGRIWRWIAQAPGCLRVNDHGIRFEHPLTDLLSWEVPWRAVDSLVLDCGRRECDLVIQWRGRRKRLQVASWAPPGRPRPQRGPGIATPLCKAVARRVRINVRSGEERLDLLLDALEPKLDGRTKALFYTALVFATCAVLAGLWVLAHQPLGRGTPWWVPAGAGGAGSAWALLTVGRGRSWREAKVGVPLLFGISFAFLFNVAFLHLNFTFGENRTVAYRLLRVDADGDQTWRPVSGDSPPIHLACPAPTGCRIDEPGTVNPFRLRQGALGVTQLPRDQAAPVTGRHWGPLWY